MPSERELLEIQAQILKAFLDGMNCFIHWDNVKEQLMLVPKGGLHDGVPLTEED